MTGLDLKRLRRSMRMTQVDLGKLLEVTRDVIGRWERGAPMPGAVKRWVEVTWRLWSVMALTHAVLRPNAALVWGPHSAPGIPGWLTDAAQRRIDYLRSR